MHFKVNLRSKLLFLVIVPVLIIAVVGIVYISVKLFEEGKNGLEQKSTAILSRMEAVREFVATQGMMNQTIEELIKKYPDGDLPQYEKEKVLNQVPIISSMRVGAKNASEENYEFRVAAMNPRNPENQPTPLEKDFIERFKAGETGTIVHEDEESNSIYVARSIYLDESQGCMTCHGHPSKSPWGNGTDILGYQMENWKDGDMHGVFVIKSDLTPVQENIRSAVAGISIWGIVVVVLASIIGLYYVRRITNVIFQIKDVSKLVAQGDLRKRINITNNDELGDLALFINKMVDSVVNVFQTVKEAARELNNAAGEISSSSNSISEGAQRQAAQFEEISGSVQSTADSSSDANAVAGSSSDNASEAGKGMNELKAAMEKIHNRSLEIEKTIDVLRNISFQTNLLALNAGVEAARAGEHGKGFAVVAQEVKKLANESDKSAKEIAEIIRDSVVSVEQGVKLTEEAGKRINKIVDAAQNISGELNSISNATSEQAKAMDDNTNITNSNAASAEELAASSSSLKERANQLNDIIEQYKLK